jgi:lactate dehydrogenase-like 2-hydroxyacid dehydrogenase
MLITLTSTHIPKRAEINALKLLGKFRYLSGKFQNTESNRKILEKTEVLLANPRYFGYIDKTILDICKHLKYLSLMSSGYNWVDINYAKRKGIMVSTAKGGSSQSVAEYAWTLALALAKNLTKKKQDKAVSLNMEISGKNVGVIGYGQIGKAIAKIGKGFGVKVYYYSRSHDGSSKIATYISKSSLLKKSDIIFICLPLTKLTRPH